MVYVISLLSVAAFPLAVAGYGGHLAAKVLAKPERRRALLVLWVLAALGALYRLNVTGLVFVPLHVFYVLYC
jgi:hypothetical protein